MIIKVWNCGSESASNFIEVASIFCKIEEFADLDQLLESLDDGDIIFVDYDFKKRDIEKAIKTIRSNGRDIYIMMAANSMSPKQLSKHQKGKYVADLYLKTPLINSFFEAVLIANFDYEPTDVSNLINIVKKPKVESVPVDSKKSDEDESENEDVLHSGDSIKNLVSQLKLEEAEEVEEELILSATDSNIDFNLNSNNEEVLNEMQEQQLSPRALDLSEQIQAKFDKAYVRHREATEILKQIEKEENEERNRPKAEISLDEDDALSLNFGTSEVSLLMDTDGFDLGEDILNLDDNGEREKSEGVPFLTFAPENGQSYGDDPSIPEEGDLEYPDLSKSELIEKEAAMAEKKPKSDEIIMEDVGEIQLQEVEESVDVGLSELSMDLEALEIDTSSAEGPETLEVDSGDLDLGDVEELSLDAGNTSEAVTIEDVSEINLGEDILDIDEKDSSDAAQEVESDLILDEVEVVQEAPATLKKEEDYSTGVSLIDESIVDELNLSEDDSSDKILNLGEETDLTEDSEELSFGTNEEDVSKGLEFTMTHERELSDEDLELPESSLNMLEDLDENLEFENPEEEELIEEEPIEEELSAVETSLETQNVEAVVDKNLDFDISSAEEVDSFDQLDEPLPKMPDISMSESFQEKMDEIDEMLLDEDENPEIDTEESTTLGEDLVLTEAKTETVAKILNTPSLDVMKEHQEVARMKDSELERLGETINALREDREALLKRIDDLELSKDEERKELLNLRSQLDEKKIELTLMRKRSNQQVEELKYQLNLVTEKKAFIEEKNKQQEMEIEKLSKRVKIDIGKVKNREKELESKLELLRADASVQIRNRDQKILELKRKIDTMEFDMETMQAKEKTTISDNSLLEEKMGKVIGILKSTLGELEEDSQMAKALKEVKKSLDV